MLWERIRSNPPLTFYGAIGYERVEYNEEEDQLHPRRTKMIVITACK